MKTILEQIDEHLSKPWNRGYIMTISNRLNGTKSYCVEIKNSRSMDGDRYFIKKEDCVEAEAIIVRYNKIRSDAQKEKTLKTKEKTLAKKEKKEKDALEALESLNLSPDVVEDEDEEEEIEEEEIEEPEEDIGFSEKMVEVIKKRDKDEE